jgi:hypothetical protein
MIAAALHEASPLMGKVGAGGANEGQCLFGDATPLQPLPIKGRGFLT